MEPDSEPMITLSEPDSLIQPDFQPIVTLRLPALQNPAQCPIATFNKLFEPELSDLHPA